MSQLSELYKKSGLADLINRNKSLLTLGGLTGGLGAGLGFLKDTARNKQDALNATNEKNQNIKNTNNQNLDNFLGNITGPTSPTGTIGSVTGQPVLSYNPSSSASNGGITNGTGEATKDQNRLLAEAEYQKQLGLTNATSSQDTRTQLLQQYADLIAQQQNAQFDTNAPGIYEDLNTRGLLRSSELGNAFGREKAKAAETLATQVGLQGLQDRQANLNDISGINDQYSQGRYGAIQRGMSLEDFARQTKAAQLTGLALAPIPQAAPSAKGGSALQGAIGGGTIGASVGGPVGAGTGALLGLVGGGSLGSK